jgi:hypothetical protein
MFKYLVSFTFKNTDGSWGFGDLITKTSNPIDESEILLIRTKLTNDCAGTKNLVIMNIIPLPLK